MASRRTLLAVLSTTLLFIYSNAYTALGGSKIASGIYDNPEGAPVIDLIDSAQKTLDMEIYEMDDPDVIQAIRDALKRGVVVHIIKEPKPVGASCHVFEGDNSDDPSQDDGPDGIQSTGPRPASGGAGAAPCEDQQQLVDDVNNAGGEYIPFARPELCGGDGSKNCLEHGKIMVVDSKLALVTSGNFNTTNLCDLSYSPKTCNRDYSYITDDSDVVQTLQQVVEKDRKGKGYDPDSLMVGSADQKLTIGGDSLDPIVSFIQSAKKSIIVENQYLKDPTMNDALIAAAKSGVDVQVIVSSACAFGKPKASDIKKVTSIYTAFDKAGIESRMFNKNMKINGKQGYLHAKAIVVDGERAWMGSVNGSTQALTLNREFGVFFDDAKDVQKLASVMSSDFSDENEESWQDSLDCAENQR